ncbi:HAD-IA family hydrolase [Amycolatopsis saalfeldensis]|uniref:HAD-IA family hydrolase n=1 Tax=Amycolatopsis saalfeldensis TaxID=394193 RepID=UPI003CCBE3B3
MSPWSRSRPRTGPSANRTTAAWATSSTGRPSAHASARRWTKRCRTSSPASTWRAGRASRRLRGSCWNRCRKRARTWRCSRTRPRRSAAGCARRTGPGCSARRCSPATVGCAKPDPEIFRLLLEKLGAEPADCLFFDDRQSNVDGARAVGIQAHLWDGAEAARAALG